ncbi:glycerophosphodiester phosphodiesterase [Dictyobacter kobayashii]|uniref:Glycerophosphoryl diester phosphodiesterase n=1 Tax=Dictyobacter kobayashii TaxID=2014872 RepID=A0A402AQL5_9CHLR|nr:glycerophosphodiester phosphodiesterase [Dictyobacter kobayashii]GCE21416.1 glycerophosphoryl diester phosphodiesterase [Dictyobacter kobayashii]
MRKFEPSVKGAESTLFPGLRRPYIFAHQGGELLAPTNTMAAFAVADAIGGVDFLDVDVHMTRDGHIVGIHDATVDRTTNGQGRVDSFTLAELQQLDAGYHFQDLQGQYSYRGKGVYIPALEEVFQAYGSKYYLHFEVKDAYPKQGPSQIEEKLWALIQKYQMERRVIVSSFLQSVVSRFQTLSGGRVVTGGGRTEVTNFVLAHKARLPWLYRRRSMVLSLPDAHSGVNLKDPVLFQGARRKGIELYYWTIDEPGLMRQLIEMGVDGLFTNRPDLLKALLIEMGLR